jgi:hypothetical protein
MIVLKNKLFYYNPIIINKIRTIYFRGKIYTITILVHFDIIISDLSEEIQKNISAIKNTVVYSRTRQKGAQRRKVKVIQKKQYVLNLK